MVKRIYILCYILRVLNGEAMKFSDFTFYLERFFIALVASLLVPNYSLFYLASVICPSLFAFTYLNMTLELVKDSTFSSLWDQVSSVEVFSISIQVSGLLQFLRHMHFFRAKVLTHNFSFIVELLIVFDLCQEVLLPYIIIIYGKPKVKLRISKVQGSVKTENTKYLLNYELLSLNKNYISQF